MSVLLICFKGNPSYHVTSNLAESSFVSLEKLHVNSMLLPLTAGLISGLERIFGKLSANKYHSSFILCDIKKLNFAMNE